MATSPGTVRVDDWYLSVSDESVTELVKESGRDASGFIGHGLSFSADREIMLCPLCGFPYIHLGRQVNIPGGYYEAAPKMVRGSVIAIPSSCENGHDLIICFGSHKGNVVVWSMIVEDGDGLDEAVECLDRTLESRKPIGVQTTRPRSARGSKSD